MNEQRASEGVDHLQAAALEMIEAARAFLDVLEDAVSDRERVAEVFTTVTDVARAATRKPADRPANAGPAARSGADGADERSEGAVQRIILSS